MALTELAIRRLTPSNLGEDKHTDGASLHLLARAPTPPALFADGHHFNGLFAFSRMHSRIPSCKNNA